MDSTYWIMLGILLVMSVFGLVVGVSNDAANFLNSALGCRAGSRRVVLAFAAAGVLLGAAFSGGMMEIARNGVFVPDMFTFHDMMLLFLAVMVADVLLLDVFNSLGLPTSTTVSLVFALLGAGLAVAVAAVEGGTGFSPHLGDYIRGGRALGIVSGIFCSVAVAFTCGTVVMWFSRLLFSFRYSESYRWLGSLWCAVSLTSITWFAVFKGMKDSVLAGTGMLDYLMANLPAATLCVFCVWLAVALVAQFVFRLNVLKFVVLCGTAALAFAFAGNDLVNFIGVFMAAESACQAASAVAAAGGNAAAMPMGCLADPVQAETLYLVLAGLVMVGALCFSRKAEKVTETEIKLSGGKRGEKERFGSCLPARLLVRHALLLFRGVARLVPARVVDAVNARFSPVEAENGAAYDLIRGSVNLTVSALLISLATSLKLPLSTTYVTFMVAMGSALSDRAWGRESAVYRITGVLTVIGGWFMTALAACAAAFVLALVMVYGGTVAMVALTLVTGVVLVRSLFAKEKENAGEQGVVLGSAADIGLAMNDVEQALLRMQTMNGEGIAALVQDDARSMKKLRKEAKALRHRLEDTRSALMQQLPALPADLTDQARRLFHCLNGVCAVAGHVHEQMKAGYRYLADMHGGITPAQAQELAALSGGRGEPAGYAAALARQLSRAAEEEDEFRSGLLFLTMLNESRAMGAHAASLEATLRGEPLAD